MRNAYRKRNPSAAAAAAMREIQRALYGPAPLSATERAEHLARVQAPRTDRQTALPLRPQ